MMKPIAAMRQTWRLRRMRIDEHGDLEPVYIWDALVRLTHWLIVLSIAILAVTGYYISKPFVQEPGPAGAHFVTGWIRVIHFYAAIVFSCSVLARFIWIFIGPRRSGWREFVPTTKERFRHIFGVIKFYALLSKEPPMAVGHNPLAGLSYVFAYSMYAVLTLTGFALYSVNAPTSYMRFWQVLLPILHGAQGARWLHHVAMWMLLMFVAAHVSISIFVSRTEKNGTLDSIFSGYKYLPKVRKADDE
jgi:Ni/Fe-hydrogenase 1 B-type cytochrome subunit